MTQQEQYFRRLATQQAPRGGGLFGAFDAAAQRAQQGSANYGSPIQDELNRMRQAGNKYPNFGVAFDRKQNRKYVESKVVEPKLLTGERK